LTHFEELEEASKRGDFNHHTGIQQSITLAWDACLKWYRKTDNSIAWQAAMVLYPRYKWSYFEKNWTGSMTQYVTTSKIAFKKLWEDKYKSVVLSRSMQSPEPPSLLEKDLLKSILDVVAPIPKPRSNVVSGRRDQLFWYLQEQPVDHLSTMEY